MTDLLSPVVAKVEEKEKEEGDTVEVVEEPRLAGDELDASGDPTEVVTPNLNKQAEVASWFIMKCFV